MNLVPTLQEEKGSGEYMDIILGLTIGKEFEHSNQIAALLILF